MIFHYKIKYLQCDKWKKQVTKPIIFQFEYLYMKKLKIFILHFSLIYNFLYTQLAFIMNVYCFHDQETRYTFLRVLLKTLFKGF